MKKKISKDGMGSSIRFRLPAALLNSFETACDETAHKKSEIIRRLLQAWLDADKPSPPFHVVSGSDMDAVKKSGL